jgi:hypothetical protein
VHGQVREERLQLQIPTLFYPHMRMAAPVADRVAGKLNRNLPNVADELPLLFEESVLPPCRKENEPPLEPEVLEVRKTRRFAPGPCRFSNRDAVLFDDSRIDPVRVFSLRDRSRGASKTTTPVRAGISKPGLTE